MITMERLTKCVSKLRVGGFDNDNTAIKSKQREHNTCILQSVFSEFKNEIRKQQIFKIIAKEVINKFETNDNLYTKIITKKGNTQDAESKYIDIIVDVLNDQGISFSKAGSQQPYDFRNVASNLGIYDMNIEVKKSDSYTIKCNDTCPSSKCYYIIILTKYKKIICINGYDLLGGCTWVYDYLEDVNNLKQKYKKDKNQKNGPVSVYPRPNIDINVKQFL